MIGVFASLKWRLFRNGMRRTTKTPFAAFGFAMSVLGSVVGAAGGFWLFSSLRNQEDPAQVHRVMVLGAALVVFGWWIGPLVSGGVDETVDPARLVLLPLTRTQIRRGQVVAGLIGMAPMAMIIWMIGIVVGMARSATSALVVVPAVLLILLGGLVGSRALATSLARLSRSRRGGDVAGILAAVGGAGVFAVLQLARFVKPAALDPLVSVLRWTPPGMVGDAIEASARGAVIEPLLRLLPLAGAIVAAGWWWTRQLDFLLTDTARRSSADRGHGADSSLAIFSGLRRRLPHTPAGAARAKEVVYLRRSPGRRTALFSGTALGVVYVVVFVGGLGDRAQQSFVLAAPVAMLFSLQYASNQFGVDPTSFWMEVVTGAPPFARIIGRQLLAVVTLSVPVVFAAVITAAWTGGWVEFAATLAATACSLPSIVGVGSMASPSWAVPIPDSGNPFSNRQTLGGNGCMAGLVGFIFMLLVAGMIVPIELALTWAIHNGHLLWCAAIIVVSVVLNGVVWHLSTRTAARWIVRRELEVLARLDARLSR